ncbi:MAG: hypothetical protein QOH06_4569 [Acidobacteriota bacterium]|jgi:hypothetical protein|nr:hypothetical protein [Acidobacteriota bacterium]
MGQEIPNIRKVVEDSLGGKVLVWITQDEAAVCYAIVTEWIRMNLRGEAQNFRIEMEAGIPRRYIPLQEAFTEKMQQWKDIQEETAELTRQYMTVTTTDVEPDDLLAQSEEMVSRVGRLKKSASAVTDSLFRPASILAAGIKVTQIVERTPIDNADAMFSRMTALVTT